MASVTAPKKMVHTAAEALLPDGTLDYDRIICSDGKPVESLYAEKQMRLLTSPLYTSWPGPGDDRPFLVASDVGLFYAYREPPVVPDVMLSVDVVHDPRFKSYFVWEYGKTPDATVEIVSGTDGEELGRKKRIYQKIGIPYYIVWDPNLFLSDQALQCFILQGRKYQVNGAWFPEIGLGVTIWHGAFEAVESDWLRWCDENGTPILTPEEKVQQVTQRAESEKQRAESEKQRAESEKQRAAKLAEKLRAMGVDPDQP